MTEVETREEPILAQHRNAYNIFILVLTLLTLAVMVGVLLPLDQATIDILLFYGNLICVIFPGRLRGQHQPGEAKACVLDRP
ncbi:MAG: hypothetical protein LH650_12465 [Chloroflexi bacterium]|nr:hypothetical protein [Chloroflexota bacterium]